MKFYNVSTLCEKIDLKVFDIIRKNERICPVEKAGHLESRFRKWAQNPNKILRNYVKEGMTALDLGCGSGFFSIPMAEIVGESGKLIAVDVQGGMLEKLKNKIKGKEIEKRIMLHNNEKDEIGISEKADFILAFYVLHEVPNQNKFLEEIYAILKTNGNFFLVEPKLFHVSKKAFKETERKAISIGFSPIERPRIFLSRAILFTKPI